MSFEVEWIASAARFAELAPAWDAILPARHRPFDLHCWHSAWLSAFAGGRDPAVCVVHEGGILAGALPMLRDGRHLQGLANAHSCDFRPLARDGEAMEALIAASLDGAAGLTLSDLPDDDPSLERLLAGARAARMAPVLEPGNVSPLVDTSGDVDVWAGGEHAGWKKRLRRYRRKIEKDYSASFAIVRQPIDLEAELSDGFALEASGWKGEAGTAIVSDLATEAFYREIAAEFDDRGELRMNSIQLDGKPVAFSVCIEHGNRLYSLKSGFDEGFRKLVPGLVLQVSIIEDCFERGLDAYELLGNETEWKRKLATGQRTHSTLRAYRRNPRGLARRTYRASLRPRLRRLRRRFSRAA